MSSCSPTHSPSWMLCKPPLCVSALHKLACAGLRAVTHPQFDFGLSRSCHLQRRLLRYDHDRADKTPTLTLLTQQTVVLQILAVLQIAPFKLFGPGPFAACHPTVIYFSSLLIKVENRYVPTNRHLRHVRFYMAV